jgi:hypothetical protein
MPPPKPNGRNTFEIPFSSAFSGGLAAKKVYLTIGKAQLLRK